MKILDNAIAISELKQIAQTCFIDMVKVVVDIDKGLVAIDAELHSDLEALLLEKGSRQKDLWGINLYPDMHGEDFIEFDSMINIRPSQENMSRGVDNKEIYNKIIDIVNKMVVR
jgi:hypothetical protein